jgi:hypothetical protein
MWGIGRCSGKILLTLTTKSETSQRASSFSELLSSTSLSVEICCGCYFKTEVFLYRCHLQFELSQLGPYMMILALWDVDLCRVVNSYRHFGRTYSFHLPDQEVLSFFLYPSTRRYNLEGLNLNEHCCENVGSHIGL